MKFPNPKEPALTAITPGDKLQFDGKATTWLVRDVANNGIALATASLFGQVYYTLIDETEGIRGALNVIGGGLGIETINGDDPNIVEAIDMINEGGFGISHRNRIPLNITKHEPKEPRMSKTTAVATLATTSDAGYGQTTLGFQADYNDERNKEWAKYTPALAVQMTVLDSVAEKFEQGGRYLLTFERQD